MLQCKWRHGKREEVFFHAHCEFTESLISRSPLTSDVQGFLLPVERRMLKVLGGGVGLLYEEEFFFRF